MPAYYILVGSATKDDEADAVTWKSALITSWKWSIKLMVLLSFDLHNWHYHRHFFSSFNHGSWFLTGVGLPMQFNKH